MIISILSTVIILFIFVIMSILYYLTRPYMKKNRKIAIYNKIAKLQYNRFNNQEYLNRNPFAIFVDDILENSYTILDKIV